jgi:multiple sugar transport system ATP-binding protein
MAEIRLENVHKTYKGGVDAVIDLNLTIQDGEFLALLGPSGCGKTSTLRMIVGLEGITKGNIFIGDRLVNHLEPKDRNVALAFETYALYPPLTIAYNISFCLRAKSIPQEEINRRVAEVARMLDIQDILHRKPGEIGGGQKQRVSLARALVRDPDVLLLDEPLSHLDAAQRAHMRTELKRLHAKIRRTTILVTHDQLEAVAMAERIAVMNFGVLQQLGTFDDIYNRPANEFVAGFVGEPPMNMLLCVPQAEGDDLHLVAKDGSFSLKLNPSLKATVLRKNPKEVKLGIRPIDIEVSYSPSNDGALEISGMVVTYESLGEEGQVVANVGESEMLAVTPPSARFVPDERVWLQLNTQYTHLFDAETGRSLVDPEAHHKEL